MTDVREPVVQAAVATWDEADIPAIQRRTVRTLLSSQVCGGVGLVSGYVVTALLAKDLTGSTAWAGLSAACLSIGAAIASYPLARIMARAGRRPGLRTGYLVGTIGTLCAVMAAVTRFFPLLPIGVALAGAGSAANLATRYAASDLSPAERRARTIGLIVWATTIGSGFGSLISLSFLDPLGRKIGLPDYGGSYVAGALLFLIAAAIVEFRLRPDPLVVAGGVGKEEQGTLWEMFWNPFKASMKLIMAHPQARLAVLAMMISQATMVGTMTLTPLHMKDGHQSSGSIGWMMFFHILGMYALSPMVGSLTDRVGRYPMLYVSGILCAVGALWAATTPADEFFGLAGGMTVVGLAWCFGVIAASGLLTESFSVEQRANVQGAGDLCMAGFGAVAGISAGGIVALRSYHDLNIGAAGLGILLVLAVAATVTTTRRGPAAAGPATA